MRLPPPSRRYSAISVITCTRETAAVSNSRSISRRSSCSRSKISLAVAIVGVLTRAPLMIRLLLVRPVIRELHVDAEVVAPQQCNHFLQGIAILARNPHRIPLYGCLCLLLRVLDQFDDIFGLFRRNPLLQRHLLPHA